MRHWPLRVLCIKQNPLKYLIMLWYALIPICLFYYWTSGVSPLLFHILSIAHIPSSVVSSPIFTIFNSLHRCPSLWFLLGLHSLTSIFSVKNFFLVDLDRTNMRPGEGLKRLLEWLPSYVSANVPTHALKGMPGLLLDQFRSERAQDYYTDQRASISHDCCFDCRYCCWIHAHPYA